MAVPKSVVKINKNGVQYTSDVEKAKYLIFELSRAALRDVGKYVSKEWRKRFYSHFKRRTGKGGKAIKYQVIAGKNTTHPRVQIGLPHASRGKSNQGFYAFFSEFGTSRTPRLGLLQSSVNENIAEIIKIESQYLSGLESEARALALVDENDFEGGADD